MRRPDNLPHPKIFIFPSRTPAIAPRRHSLTLSPTMASLHQIPRFLLPRGPLLLRTQPRAFPPLQLPTPLRYASSSSKSLSEEFRRRQAAQQQKTPVIPQPDKFRPPSHKYAPRKNNLDNKVYGPPLTEEDKKRMATKKYPNMMSPEGTFSHWFFNNRAIHLWITMVLLSFFPSPACSQPDSH